MGCGVSNVRCKVSDQNSTSDDADMKLSSCRIAFSQQQLIRLNQKFSSLIENNVHTEAIKERRTACLSVVVERLIQRLVCNVGNLDKKFSSKFLINLEPLKTHNHEIRENLKYKYLVRLDVVSTPALYPDFFKPPIRLVEGTEDKSLPQGYAKVRVHGEFLEQWAGFLSPNGYLRRDKVQEKFLELLTKAAARPSEPFSPANVDESKQCGAPGKIVDPVTLSYILRSPASNQVFFGSDECNELRFPDPRDFRIAIVEGVPETRLHISFLSPAAQSITSDVEISIILGIGVAGWPMGTNYPSRLPLDHIDVLLGYRAAQLGYYLVPKGPHPSIYCEDRSSVWEIRALPTEMFLEHHYSPTSVVSRIYKILLCLLEILKARGVKTITKYILKNLLFFELENKKRIQQWKPKCLSRRVISILDKLHGFLQNQMIPSYIFTEKNLLQDDAFEDDYVSDKEIIEQYLKQLQNDEFKAEVNYNEWFLAKDELENVLLKKWDNVIASLLPPRSNRSKRLSTINNSPVVVTYTRHQMEYVALLIQEVLKLKNIQRKSALMELPKFNQVFKEESTEKEDFIYLLQVMFDQAKQKLIAVPAGTFQKKMSSKKMMKLDQLLLNYDISTSMILDNIRRSKQTEYDFADDLSIVKRVMECLYKAMDSDGKSLGPILRPYLNQIFKGSHENCWFFNEWKKQTDFSEFEAIEAFSELVLSRTIQPLDGIINSTKKGWNWATNCLKIIQAITEENSTRVIIGEKINLADSGLRLIFAPSPGRTIRCNVSITKPLTLDNPKSFTETADGKHGTESRYATIKSFQDIFESTISSAGVKKTPDISEKKGPAPVKNQKPRCEKQPFHIQLRDGSPFTVASMETRRQGNHRGIGSIVQALISLQKLTILQEISQYLPENERTRVLSDIKKLSKEVHRVAVENYRKKKSFSFSEKSRLTVKKSTHTFSSKLMPQKRISKVYTSGMETSSPLDSGIYRSFSEFSVFNEKDDIQKNITCHEKDLYKKIKEDSLRGTCRQLRKASRPTAFGSSPSYTFPKAGFYRKGPSKTIINPPFYIKVSSYGNVFPNEKIKVSKTLKL